VIDARRWWRSERSAWTAGVACALAVAAGPAAAAHAQGDAGAPPRFEPSACPSPHEPIEALATARCGFLVVPENRVNPSARTIRLAVAVLPATSPTPAAEPIVFMTGGPGASAIHEIPFLVDAGVNANHQLIVMAQRGTQFDEPDLNCPELDRYYGRQVSLRYDAASTGRTQAAAAKACRDRLAAQGIDLGSYNTTENAADFADLVKALGISSFNIYGYSYGSDLALSFMRDHPQGIRSATIDSVVPPNIVSLPWTWSSAREGITTIFRACAAQPRCAKAYPHLQRTFTTVVRRLERKPIVARVKPPQDGPAVKVILDGGTIVNMLVANRPAARDVPAALTALAHGDASTWLKVRAAGSEVPEFPEQAQGMTQSFVCGEWAPYGGPADILAAGRRVFPRFPATVLVNAPQLPFEQELCRRWDVPKRPDSQRARVVSDIPTLVVSGTFDAKTGARWGRYAASGLSQSTYVPINGVGHWVIAQSPCAQQIFQSFLAAPLSPDTACAPKTRPAPFTIE
jgi:pimeloyl-ACP methyl ester carboxylesterase